jgi:hypothetical protein
MKVALIAISDTAEAQLLRLALESVGAVVHLHGIGKPSDFFTAFDHFGISPDVAIICGHGDDNGFIVPEMAPGVDTLVLPADRLTPTLIADHLGAAPPVVISTACGTGLKSFATAFIAAGATNYIAPKGYPDGAAVPALLHLAAYRVQSAGSSWEAAIRAANNFMTLENQFDIWR